jgi:hypothetical protein
MSNNSELIMPMPLAGPVRPPQGPPRRTYGKKRILDPDLLDAPEVDARVKKTSEYGQFLRAYIRVLGSDSSYRDLREYRRETSACGSSSPTRECTSEQPQARFSLDRVFPWTCSLAFSLPCEAR